MSENNDQTRRKFMQQSAALGASMMLANPAALFSATDSAETVSGRIKSRGYAARDNSGFLSKWEFERRPLGDDDILIDIKFAGICHSDIHQLKGDWGPEQYPQVPGHEIAGIVSAVGKNVTRFKVGDRAGVGCMVDSCMTCESCKKGEEQHCENHATRYTYGSADKDSPTGITQGGYSNNIVIKEHFAIHIPENIRLEDAAPLLCAGITTYSPLMKAEIQKGTKVGVAGIGGLGHMAVKLAVSKGAEVYAFTTSPDKEKDILSFGAKEVIVLDDLRKIIPYSGQLDYMISTIPVQFNVAAYASAVKPYGHFTQVGMPKGMSLNISHIGLAISRVNFNSSLIGGMPETQEVVTYCAQNNIAPQIEMISADQANDAWQKVVDKKARYRYVIDTATI